MTGASDYQENNLSYQPCPSVLTVVVKSVVKTAFVALAAIRSAPGQLPAIRPQQPDFRLHFQIPLQCLRWVREFRLPGPRGGDFVLNGWWGAAAWLCLRWVRSSLQSFFTSLPKAQPKLPGAILK